MWISHRSRRISNGLLGTYFYLVLFLLIIDEQHFVLFLEIKFAVHIAFMRMWNMQPLENINSFEIRLVAKVRAIHSTIEKKHFVRKIYVIKRFLSINYLLFIILKN